MLHVGEFHIGRLNLFMKQFLKAKSFCILLLFIWAATATGSEPNHDPVKQLQGSIDAIIKLLRDPGLKKPDKKEQLRSEISDIIRERFDFKEMAKRSLGLHWRKRNAEERKHFVQVFSELVQESYIGKIENYTDQTVSYGEVDIRDKYAAVHTVIQSSQKADLPIIYKMKLDGDKWRVYDVDIEGVSLVNTYRDQFNNIISQNSYEDLVDRMKSKLEKIKSHHNDEAPAS